MKLAFVGKGGSGKTTIASLFARHAVARPYRVMAIDADINQHFGKRLGLDPRTTATLAKLSEHIGEIKEYLRGENPLIPTNELMLKTTPPGPGSRLLTLAESNPLYSELFTSTPDGIRFATTGDFKDEDLGKRCYHSKTAAVELLLGHLVDLENEFVVVDMVAGAEIFGSGMFTRFDAIVAVVEPTDDSLDVYRQVMAHAATYKIPVWVVGNKIEEREDKEFLQAHIASSDQIIGWFQKSRYVKAAARGMFRPIKDLEPENIAVLDAIMERALSWPKEWERLTELAHLFHKRAVEDWGSHPDFDLTAQNVPGYVPGPQMLD